MKKMKIIGIIIVYNQAQMLQSAFSRLPKNVFSEIIAVDDGSTDSSLEIAKKLGIKVFTHPHLGYGGNLKFGFKKALELGADYLVEIHGDGQYDHSNVKEAIQIMTKNHYEFLSGSRFTPPSRALKNGMPIHRFLANSFLSFMDRLILNVPLTDFNSGFRIYSKKLIETLPLKKMSNELYFALEIIMETKRIGFKIGEIPTNCDYHRLHTSIKLLESIRFTFKNLTSLFIDHK